MNKLFSIDIFRRLMLVFPFSLFDLNRFFPQYIVNGIHNRLPMNWWSCLDRLIIAVDWLGGLSITITTNITTNIRCFVFRQCQCQIYALYFQFNGMYGTCELMTKWKKKNKHSCYRIQSVPAHFTSERRLRTNEKTSTLGKIIVFLLQIVSHLAWLNDSIQPASTWNYG